MSDDYQWKAYTVPVSIPALEVPDTPRWLVEWSDELMESFAYGPRLASELRRGMPNIMPRLNWWPWIDKAIATRNEVRTRVPAAWEILRHGVREDDDW